MVKWMSQGQDATMGGDYTYNRPMLTVLDFKAYTMDQLVAKVCHCLANNTAIAITSHPYENYTWDPHSIRKLFGTGPEDLGTRVVWQSMYFLNIQYYFLTSKSAAKGRVQYIKDSEEEHLPNLSKLYGASSFHDFLEKLKDPLDVVNLLDIPIDDGHRPELIKMLSADVHAWNSTFSLGATTKPGMPSRNPLIYTKSRAGSRVAKPLTPEAIVSDLNIDHAGPGQREFDITRWRRWALASGNTFYTYPHYDASGLCTWSMITVGMKVWSYLRPKIDDPTSIPEAAKAFINVANAAGSVNYGKASTTLPAMVGLHNLFLTPGTLL